MRYEAHKYSNFAELIRHKTAQRDLKDIGMGEWQTGRDALVTYAASTCIVLAVHNEDTRQGLIGHFSEIALPEKSAFSHQTIFLNAVYAIDELGEPRHNHIWLGGGAPFIENGSDSVAADRKFAEIAIRKYLENHDTPIQQTRVQWSEAYTVIDTKLNCQSGLLEVHNYPDTAMKGLELEALISRASGVLPSSADQDLV